MLQQEAYLLFYIRDKDHKPTSIPFPPGSPALKLQSSSHFKTDPNFLGRSNKQFPSPSSQRSGLDKTGTPLVRMKPTGVVQPSPQKDTPTTPKPLLPTKGQSSSPPVPTNTGGLVTPKSKSASVSPSSSGGSGNGMTSPLVRDFSIPLRKISSTTTNTSSRTVTDKTEAARPSTLPQQQATPTTTTSLRFTPRQISAPSSKNKKKIALVTSASQNQETEKTSGGDKETRSVASDVVHKADIQTAPSIASQTTNDKTVTKDDESIVLDSSESKTAATFRAIESEDPTTTVEGFIGPLLPSSPTPTQPQSPIRVNPFSLKPSTTSPVSSKAVAMVPPQPQAREKPVARVRPNPHLQEDEESTPQRKVASKEGGSLPGTPAPHLNAVSPWKVRDSTAGEVFGPALPDDMEYNSAAHGWNVSAISGGEEAQEKGEQQATPHGKAKKHKKKKKHRKREEENIENEGVWEGGKRERNKESSSSKKIKNRDERGRRHHSHSPDRGHHHHDSRRSPERTTPHHDKYRSYRRPSYRDRDRDTTEHHHRGRQKQYSKGNRYSHHDRSRSHSRSRSRSPLRYDSEDRYHHQYRDKYRSSPSRHTHQHHHHAPYSDMMGESGGGHWKSHHHHSPHHRPKHGCDSSERRVNIKTDEARPKHSSDSSERRVNIKSDEARRRERKRSHHHDAMSEDEGEHKKHRKCVPSGKVD